ncbi:MAG: hypothetical protein HOV96_36190, partial [Nonomuraea sp.]|nr:hypothetical protein [Nonomuraea sp.]
MMSSAWRGWCLLRPGLMLYGGAIGGNDLHAHHAVQLIVATEPFTMADAHGERLTTRLAVIPPDTGHTVLTGARDALLVHLDPRSSPGRSLLARSGAGPGAPSWSPSAARAGHGPPPIDPVSSRPAVRVRTRPLMFTEPPVGHARSAEAASALRAVEAWSGL